MITTVSGPLRHLCPHVDEVDDGTVEITFFGPAPELHNLATELREYADMKITHEELTKQLAARYKASVCTKWHTAGLEVAVVVGGSGCAPMR